MNGLKGRDFISINDFTKKELEFYLDTALKMKLRDMENLPTLKGKNLAMIFQKPSLRTRVSFQVGMNQLGGNALFISPNEIQIGKREAVKDVAAVLSRYVDGIMARVFSHNDVLDLAKYADVPVINGLSDLLHPCQGMADYLTILEKFGKLKGIKLSYIGDGNNVCHTLMYGAAKFGVEMKIACPKGYGPKKDILSNVEEQGAHVEMTHDPVEAVKGAQVVYTDTWVSMGQEGEMEKRIKDFKGFQLNSELMSNASEGHIVMHCLPAHRDLEITDEVMDGKHSVIYEQAENRLHAQKAIMALNI